MQGLSPEQFVQENAGPLSSVRQQFIYLLSVTDRYRARLAQEDVPDVSPETFATPQDLVIYEAQMRRRLSDFIRGLNKDRLEHVVEHNTRKGLFRTTVSQTLFQMINHATYHRGQVACLLKLYGVDFDDTDFTLWIDQVHNKQN